MLRRVLVALAVALALAGGLYVASLVRNASPSQVATATSPVPPATTDSTAAATESARAAGESPPAASESAPAAATSASAGVSETALPASPTPTASPLPTASASPVPFSLTTPEALPTAEPAPSASVNYLALARGAIVRSWLPAETDYPPIRLLTSNDWKPKEGAKPPYEFVFELPALTTIARFGVMAAETTPSTSPNPSDTSLPGGPTASVLFSVSTQSSSAGFGPSVVVPIGTDGTIEHFGAAPANTTALFVRVHVDVPAGVTFTELDKIAAYGTQAPLPSSNAYSGPWYRDDAAADSPWVDAVHGRFLDTPDPERLRKLGLQPEQLWYAMHRDPYAEFARCDNSDDSSVLPAFDDGSHRLIGRGPTTFVYSPHGDRIVFSDESYGYHFFFPVQGSKQCLMHPPIGAGPQHVLVLTRDSSYDDSFAPAADIKTYPGYRYTSQFTPFFDPAELRHVDTLVFGSSCTLGLELMQFQTSAILDFVRAGHKLIIHDADRCRQANYWFLPYPLALSTAGAQGQAGKTLELVESDPLGTDKTDPRRFIDTNAFVAAHGQQLADSDIIYSTDPHWCGHLLNTNSIGVSGFVQAYAHYGNGLIIYDGIDIDNADIKQYQQISQYELAVPVSANLPCSRPVGGFLLDPASSQHEYVAGKNQRIAVDLSAVALLTYSGNVRLSATGPFPVTLSQPSVTVKANRTPFGVLIDVPKTARGGGHHFIVHGDDGAGHTSSASIDLVPGRTSQLERTLQATGRITLHNILFDTASAKLRPESYAVLTQIADALGRNPKWRLRIDGHTDNVGGAEYNLALSQHRAASVKTALVTDFRIDKRRLTTAGYGLTKPVASNDTDAGRQLNRRVELVRI